MTRARTPLVAPLFLLLTAWVPDFTSRNQVRETLDHRCRDVRLGRYDGMRVTCNGDQVEVLHATTTSAAGSDLWARVAWRSSFFNDTRVGSPIARVVVSIDDDIVLVENELCVTCNVQRGPVWVFRPARTRPEVLRAIQRAIHVPAAVARTSVAAWRER
jgi:hypothetical protein